MEIEPITPEKYQQIINEQAKAMTAGDIVNAMENDVCPKCGKPLKFTKGIEIGNNVLMASHVFISDNSHGSYKCNFLDSDPTVPPAKRNYVTAPIKIGNNVWIGEGVMIMPGVTIGDGCVIGAHSIVNKSIPENTIAVGTPAKVIKQYNFETKHWEKA